MISLISLFRNRIWRQSLIAGLIGLLVGSVFACMTIVVTSQSSPIVVHEERELDTAARNNGHLDLYIDLDRVRDCPSETSRWLWTWVDHDGQRIKQFYPLVNTTTTLSEIGRNQRFVLSIPIPPGVWPGQWHYWSKTVEHCSWLPALFHDPVRESDDIPISIIDGTP